MFVAAEGPVQTVSVKTLLIPIRESQSSRQNCHEAKGHFPCGRRGGIASFHSFLGCFKNNQFNNNTADLFVVKRD